MAAEPAFADRHGGTQDMAGHSEKTLVTSVWFMYCKQQKSIFSFAWTDLEGSFFKQLLQILLVLH